jgi:hypothetical protein
MSNPLRSAPSRGRLASNLRQAPDSSAEPRSRGGATAR